VPLALLVVANWVLIFALLIRGVLLRRRGLAVPLAALCVCMTAIIHSMIDFSMQIPGYAIVVCLLAGAGIAQSFPRPAPTEEQRPQMPAEPQQPLPRPE
jgi:hypothetical protein